MRLLCVALTLGCALNAAPDTAARVSCDQAVLRRWLIPAAGERALRVWLDAGAQELDGWRPYGARRLRLALDEWNSIRLPVQFITAKSARESDIIVDIVPSLPTIDGSSVQNQAGITNVTYEASGRILSARILIAAATPTGRRYPVVEQQANLLHELGHALGLPHVAQNGAVMSNTRRDTYELTGADIMLARGHYQSCREGGA